MSYQEPTDVAIVTATAEELEPVLLLAGGRGSWRRFFIQEFEHLRSRFEDGHGNSLDVVASFLWKYGSNPTVAQVMRLVVLKPRLLVMTGICGGWESKGISFGDVIIAERAYQSAEGKQTRRRLQPDIQTYQPPPWLVQWLVTFSKASTTWREQIQTARPKSLRYQMEWILCQLGDRVVKTEWPTDADWPQVRTECPQYSRAIKLLTQNQLITKGGRISAKGRRILDTLRQKSFGQLTPAKDPDHAQCLYGAFATSPAVIADEGFFLRQAERVRKIRAVDMEVAAFFEAAQEIGAIAYAVKGVSDYATLDKDDIFHQYAAEASARWAHGFLQHYMAQIMLLPRCGEVGLRVPAAEKRHLPIADFGFLHGDWDYDSPSFIRDTQRPPAPWGRTNHSEHRITLRSIRQEWENEIRAAISKNFSNYVDEIAQVEEIAEDSASANFRVGCKRKPPILFRVNRRVRDAEAIRSIAAHLNKT